MTSVVRFADRVLPETRCETLREVGILALRVGFGLTLALVHGWDKLSTFGEKASAFPDPIGLGSPLSLGLVTSAEFFCGLAIAVGLLTRLAAIPPIISMSVALLFVHTADPWKVKELAVVYLVALGAIALVGAGRYSLDAVLRRIAARRGDVGASPEPTSA